jgi:hypothetical protein
VQSIEEYYKDQIRVLSQEIKDKEVLQRQTQERYHMIDKENHKVN